MIIFIKLFVILGCVISGYYYGCRISSDFFAFESIIGILAGLVLGLFLIGLDVYFKRITVRNLICIFTGVLLGLILNQLFIKFLLYALLPPELLQMVGFTTAIAFAYLGAVTILRGQDEFYLMIPFVRLTTSDKGSTNITLDTSAIIDGRIADMADCGFISGRLIIPRFVLKELQAIADSSDVLKRNRGRRGLDVLNRLKSIPHIEVKIQETDFPEISAVDTKLVKLAQILNTKVLTTDFNLSKVAELENVSVLNVNELSNALKPVVLPGEQMEIRILKEGKEADQGLAYLNDGTMIVVENGRRFIGKTVKTMVTSVLQTNAGRMIFTKMER